MHKNRWKVPKLLAVTNVKCESLGLIDMCRVSKGNKDPEQERKWKSVSQPGCGRTWGLTMEQKQNIPNELLGAVGIFRFF